MALCMMLLASFVIAPVSASAKVVKIMKVNVKGARLRSGPGASSIKKPSLKKGEKVFYSGKQVHAFCYVRTASGRTGYVYKPYLSSYGAVNSKQVYYAKKATTMYKKARKSSRRVGRLSKKQHVLVYETRGNWAYIKTLSGKGGFVKFSNLRRV